MKRSKRTSAVASLDLIDLSTLNLTFVNRARPYPNDASFCVRTRGLPTHLRAPRHGGPTYRGHDQLPCIAGAVGIRAAGSLYLPWSTAPGEARRRGGGGGALMPCPSDWHARARSRMVSAHPTHLLAPANRVKQETQSCCPRNSRSGRGNMLPGAADASSILSGGPPALWRACHADTAAAICKAGAGSSAGNAYMQATPLCWLCMPAPPRCGLCSWNEGTNSRRALHCRTVLALVWRQ